MQVEEVVWHELHAASNRMSGAFITTLLVVLYTNWARFGETFVIVIPIKPDEPPIYLYVSLERLLATRKDTNLRRRRLRLPIGNL